MQAWKARWDGQAAGTMPLPTNSDPEERLRYFPRKFLMLYTICLYIHISRADMFVKKADGTQRLATTKCFSCRTSGGPVQVSFQSINLSRKFRKSNILPAFSNDWG